MIPTSYAIILVPIPKRFESPEQEGGRPCPPIM